MATNPSTPEFDKHQPGNIECICESCCETHMRNQKLNAAGQEIADQITNYLNGQSDLKPFLRGMSVQHRTLQQCFTRLCVEWMNHLAKLEEGRGYDLRNEQSVKFAKKLVATDIWQESQYLPHI